MLAEFRWCREGAPGLVCRPGPRPAPLGRPGHISGVTVPSRLEGQVQPLALDVGSPHAAQMTGKGYFFASVRGSPHPTGPACSYDPCASKSCSGALASCAVRERQVARPVSRRRAARPTGSPMARRCGARRRLHPYMGVITNAHRLCRVLLAFLLTLFDLPGWRCRRHRRV